MATEDNQATLDENPGSEEQQTLVDPSTQETPSEPPASQPTSVEPDPAYKGLQRVLAKEQARARELEARIQQYESQPQTGQSDQIIAGLINEIGKTDPERAQQLVVGFQSYRTHSENQALRTQQAQAEADRIIKAADERNVQELRSIVIDLGADPDSPLIDYGDPNEWFAERITKVRATAKEAAKKVTPVQPPARTVDQVHSTQQGAPPASAPRISGPVTEEQLLKAQEDYARAFIKGGKARDDAEAKMRALSEKFAGQLFE